MRAERTRKSRARLAATATVLLGALSVVLATHHASAHFVLQTPPSWETQDALGSPQKLGPCGNESGGTATGTITAYQQGQTISVTINETIFHPGHYRIALAVHDRSELPPEPIVTPGSTACGSVPIDPSPAFPVLADGVLVHTAAFSGPQTFNVTLPADVTCTHCTLQIIEFMSNHGLNPQGGCFYHHCADIAIHSVVVVDGGPGDASTVSDAGSDVATTADVSTRDIVATDSAARDSATSDAATHDAGDTAVSHGCGCAVPAKPSATGAGLAGLVALAAVLRRRRRRV